MINDDKIEILLQNTVNCFIQNNKAHMTLEVETLGKIQIVVFCIILLGT